MYYDSAEELRRLAGFQWLFFFGFNRRSVQNRVCSLYSFLAEENQKSDKSLKGFRIELEARRQ